MGKNIKYITNQIPPSGVREISKDSVLQSLLLNRRGGLGGEAIEGGGLLIKICGMCNSKNIQELAQLNPDFIGFIFYPKSKRYVDNKLDINILKYLPKTIKKVGVFVNDTEDKIFKIVNKYKLDFVQLHGEETVEFCKKLESLKIRIIKAFSVNSDFDFETTKDYQSVSEFFLFDTKTAEKGGSGQTFDWQILEKYEGPTPFLLAGGIDENNFAEAQSIQNKYLIGLDLNSKFEVEPGLKNIEKLKKVLTK